MILYCADEVFVTGTAAEIAPITWIDGRIIGTGKPGPITRQCMEQFKIVVTEGRNTDCIDKIINTF
jgi:branched-chain amino acid aminotransferase